MDCFPEATSDAQRCLQFARSSAGVTTAVVGMRDSDHVEDNLALTRCEPADPDRIRKLFRHARADTAR